MHARRYLVVFEGHSSRKVELPEVGHLTVGRGEGCEIRLADGSASRTHARLEADASGVRLFDLGSANGTHVNAQRVTGPTPLLNGDVIQISRAALVLHLPPLRFPSDPLYDVTGFRRLLDEELERALRYGRPLSVCALFAEPAPDRAHVASALYRCFRRTDFATWLSDTQLVAALPEADEHGGRDHAQRLLAALPELDARAGLAFSPGDGIDLDTLLSSALAAARAAEARKVGEARQAFKRLAVADQLVLVADPAMLRLYDLMERVAATDLPALVWGETGTGKELAATILHHWSERRFERLVSVKCAALGERATEEIFAAIAATAGGTVFVDDVETLTAEQQGRLLEAITTQREVRVLTGSTADLDAEVHAGRFRGDLYAQLSRAMLWFVPLRDRPREIPLLARAFLHECAPGRQLTDAELRGLQEHRWPGNVLELRTVVEAMAGGAALETLLAKSG